jgi:multimeric flavodoxin WrbA
MKITILNGNPDPSDLGFESYLSALEQRWQAGGHAVHHLYLRDLTLAYCTGCWSCWVKTPGECAAKDDSPTLCRAVIHSDLTVLASPLRMGFTSALLKKANDKLIPLIHPYFAVVQGEAHHRARYPHYPALAVLVQPEADTDEQDLRIVNEIYKRLALNMKTKLRFMRRTDSPIQEVADEVNRL